MKSKVAQQFGSEKKNNYNVSCHLYKTKCFFFFLVKFKSQTKKRKNYFNDRIQFSLPPFIRFIRLHWNNKLNKCLTICPSNKLNKYVFSIRTKKQQNIIIRKKKEKLMRYRNSNQEHIDHLLILQNHSSHHESWMGGGIHLGRLFVLLDRASTAILSCSGP